MKKRNVTSLPEVVEEMVQLMAEVKETSPGNELLEFSNGIKSISLFIKSNILDTWTVDGKSYRDWLVKGAYFSIKYEIYVPDETHYINKDGDIVVYSGDSTYLRLTSIIPLIDGKIVEARRMASMFNLVGDSLNRFIISYLNMSNK